MKPISNILLLVLAIFLITFCNKPVNKKQPPNIILLMADDLGYGDVGYMGNQTVKTPYLDEMASQGIRFDRFYAAGPVCSPTRASCLTGRHPYRSGITWAGRYPLPDQEITLAEALKIKEYATGHFGKWHIGGLSKTIVQSEFPGGPTPYSPPWKNGFDVSFSTESMMPTYNPYYHVGGAIGKEDYRHVQKESVTLGQKTGGFIWKDRYWTEPGQFEDKWLEGNDSKIIIDRALDFIKKEAAEQNPFLAIIWFHAPHTPIVAGNEYRKLYSDQSMEAQHWFGCITAMDEQIGRLRSELEKMNIKKNTILWFCSDNGPSYIHNYNSAGQLRGKKAELYEGGIRVPAVLEWPARFNKPMVISTPVSTSDFYPTLMAITSITVENQPYLDGENILPILFKDQQRGKPIGFLSPLPARMKKQEITDDEQFALVGERYKLISVDDGNTFQLYDLKEDISESEDISTKKPGIVTAMKDKLLQWVESCRKESQKVKEKHEKAE